MAQDEFRVEVDLAEGHEGFPLGERLRALDLDDEARERLGSQVTVTRDGPRLFCYAHTRESCAEAERVIRELIAAEGLSGSLRSTRWHPTAHEWRDADEPLPSSEEEIARERAAAASHPDEELPGPAFVLIGSYKPQFLRDLGL